MTTSADLNDMLQAVADNDDQTSAMCRGVVEVAKAFFGSRSRRMRKTAYVMRFRPCLVPRELFSRLGIAVPRAILLPSKAVNTHRYADRNRGPRFGDRLRSPDSVLLEARVCIERQQLEMAPKSLSDFVRESLPTFRFSEV